MSPPTPRSLVTGGAALVVSQGVQAGVAFAANLVLILYIGPSEFGRFALVVATASLVLSIVSLRVNALVMRTPESEFTGQVRERYFAILSIETVLAGALGVGWIVASGFTGLWAFALIFVLCARHWLEQNKAYFERRMPYVRLGLLESGVAVLAHALSVILVLFGLGAEALYWREVFWFAATAVGLYAVGGLTILPWRWPHWEEWRATFREARAIWLDAALESAYQRILIQLAGLFGGDRGAGIFFQAQRLAMFPHLLLAPIGNRIGLNWLRHKQEEKQRRKGGLRLLFLMAGVLAPTALLVWLYAPAAVPAVFGEVWAPAGQSLKLMTGAVLFLTLFEILRVYCTVTHRMTALLAGRIAQYVATAAALAAAAAMGQRLTIETLAVGLSLGYVIPFAVVLLSLRYIERKSSARPA